MLKRIDSYLDNSFKKTYHPAHSVEQAISMFYKSIFKKGNL